MKNPIHAIKEAINARHELAATRSWAAYLEGEIKALNKKLCRDNISINELVRENEIISGANTRLLKELAAVRHLVGKELELVHMFKEAQYAGAVDPGFNPAEATRKPKAKVTRQRLTLEDWNKVFNAATASHLRNAMLLAMVTGQRVGDIAKMKFTDVKNGMLYVEQGKGGSRVAIPLNIRSEALGMTLGDVIAGCRDRAVSRYLVHHARRIGAANVGDALPAKALSNSFSAARDRVVIELDEGKTPPTFHEQRSLSGRLYEKQGINVQALWGHKSKKMSELYLDERNTEWIVVAV